MIEGVRALPWVLEARRDDPTMFVCDSCTMTETTPEMRQTMHCGHLAADSHVDGSRWQPAAGEEVTVCPGYTCALPDVTDVACASPHWEVGQLGLLVGESPPLALMHGLALFKGAQGTLEAHRMREQAEKQRGGPR